ncbi:DNA primase [Aceticella autotrophica]|uniref:DNA primase n=1 Tax=Aceticella autotrophica TaxID=2755338 RepID=A0A975AWR1_9THEO|nr:DNA primase [Aceticella autotrophica]QSZ27813.1 DNA primase [Aceticella autotrophica]
MSFSKDVIDKVIEENDIIDIISQYVELKKSGKDYKGLCPFHHEKTPSFNVSQEKQLYHCFGCHASGNVITFVMNMENLNFIEAVEYLAEKAGIKINEDNLSGNEYKTKKLKDEIFKANKLAALNFHRRLYSKIGHAALEYLYGRGIDDSTIKKFGLGFSPVNGDEVTEFLRNQGFSQEFLLTAGLSLKSVSRKYHDRFKNRIMFPIIDVKNNVIGFGGRVLDNSLPKYLNTPETPVFKKSKTLYAINYAKKSKEDKFVIVEGYMDAIALHQCGIDFAVASLGTALTSEQGKLIKKYRENVVISYDADEAGVNATLRGLDILEGLNLNVSISTVPKGKDPDEFVRKEGIEAFRKMLQNAEPLIEYKIKMYKKDIDLSRPEDKIKYIKKISSDLSLIKDQVKRDVYISIVSKDVQIPENTVRTEIEQFVNRFSKNNEKSRYTVGKIRHNNKYGSMKKSSSVKYLIALLLFDNKIYEKIKAKLNLHDINDDNLKLILDFIKGKLENGNKVNINDISYLMQDEKMMQEFKDIFEILYNIHLSDKHGEGQGSTISDKLIDDCISNITEMNLKLKISQIKKEISKTSMIGDIAREKELLLQLQKYEKEMLMLKNG